MKVEKVTNYLLSNDAGVSALVGKSIYPVVVPKGIQPNKYIVYQIVSNIPRPTIDGSNTLKLYNARVSVSIGASDYATLKQIVQAVRDAVHLQRGSIADASVISAQLILEGPEDFDEGSNVFFQPLDFLIIYKE